MSDGYPQRHQKVVAATRRLSLTIVFTTAAVAALATTTAAHEVLPMWVAALADAVFVLALVMASASVWSVQRHVAVIPYFERTVGEIDTFLAGQALARHLVPLDAMAQGLGLPPLSQFGFNDDLAGEPLTWHDAQEGLATVRALSDCLARQPSQLLDPENVMSDLARLAHALQRAKEQEIRFCLLLRYGNVTSGHEWDVRQGTAF
jgi:hypothetical protein